MFERELLNKHNIKLFEEMNGKAIKIENKYDATLECKIFELYGEWNVIICAVIDRESDTAKLDCFTHVDWAGKDKLMVMLSPANFTIDGKPFSDLIQWNTPHYKFLYG
jgi:hypothetical protein